MNKAPLKIGLIGTGKIARIHANNARFLAGATITVVGSRDIHRARAFADEFDITEAVGSYEEVFEHSIGVVLICSTADTHPALIESAARKGLHIFCEKPIGNELHEIDDALKAVKENGVKLSVGFNRRFDPHFSVMRKHIADGYIGKPEIVRITSRDPYPPSAENLKAQGALFLETMIHDLDMARFLVGDEVESLYAVGDALINPEFKKTGNVDTAVATLRFRDGALGVIENSWRASYGYDQRIEVHGSVRMISVPNDTPHRVEVSDREGIHRSLPLAFFPERYAASYQKELEEFVRCVREDREPPVGGEDGRIATVLALAARESYKEGTPIKIKL